MKLLHLFVINAMLVPYCIALLKCRREEVGNVAYHKKPTFWTKECPYIKVGWWDWLIPPEQHKYCMVAYCTSGNDWLTVYGCTSTNERNWCSNQLAINLRPNNGDLVCRNCTLGNENEDNGNMHFALRPETTTPPARVPPKKTTTTTTATTAKNVPSGMTTVTTTEMPWQPIILHDHGTGLKIALPLVLGTVNFDFF
uniref:Secreted protein n=1 Tax=Globodera pallida TaxID=36090 RepID=A0A183BYD9_GLOPA